ncbi:MAG: glycogen debranching protein [Lachnospiraceae bacterium]|nr:glycogen debranching protein [Lachnospiraceae bacterium]
METGYRFGRNAFRTYEEGIEREWLLTNGIGGFANCSIIGANHRIFAGYLIASLNPPVDRYMILKNIREMVRFKEQEYDLASQEYPGEIREGYRYLNSFSLDILPTYRYQVKDVTITKTIAMAYGQNKTAVCYELKGGREDATIHLIPEFSIRPFDSVCEKSEMSYETAVENKWKNGTACGNMSLRSERLPGYQVLLQTSEGRFYNRANKKTSMATPNYLVEEDEVFRMDTRTGNRHVDFGATPYEIIIKLKKGQTKCISVICSLESEAKPITSFPLCREMDAFAIADAYKKRMEDLMMRMPDEPLAKKLAIAADAFIVKRRTTGLKTILAGYPWFSDWGRDTMIALPGLTLATKRFDDARDILASFSKYISEGMIPNVFPNNASDEPQYNTIDASLWYFYSVDKYLDYVQDKESEHFIETQIYPALKEIMMNYQNGTRYNIHMDEDYLITGGNNLDQLTWMDVRVGDLVVTPRHGKAVEINALWYNALCVMEKLSSRFKEDSTIYHVLAENVKESFCNKFWNEEEGCLYDVIGEEKDRSIRPNQIFAVSLPYTMLNPDQQRSIVEVVYQNLYTPYGLCSLKKEDPRFCAEYTGKLLKRDMAYHMGTAWAYLMGPFITAYCKVHNNKEAAKKEAYEMIACFEDHMSDGCINGIAEIFDGSYSCTSRGCYTQAWSVAEILRAYIEDVRS